jgi:crotonobetainyl-CoA:carnitine CoA-transferase CaiB-like acyl-CoA transferase
VALARRNETGLGAEVDTALYEPLLVTMGELITRYSGTGEVQERVGNLGAVVSPRGLFRAADDRWLAIAGSSQRIAERVFRAMGRPELIEDPRYATNEARVRHADEVNELVGAWVGAHTRAEVLDLLEAHEVAASPVADAQDIVENEFLWERGSLVQTDGERVGGIAVPGRLVRLSGCEPVRYGDPPEVGEHTEDVLAALLGCDPAELARLRDDGVVRLRSEPTAGEGS